MKTFKLQLVTYSKSEIFDNVYSVAAESVNGKFTALADHEPFIMRLKPCIVSVVMSDNLKRKFFVNESIIKIMPVMYTVVAEELYAIGEIDENFIASYHDKNIASKIARELGVYHEIFC